MEGLVKLKCLVVMIESIKEEVTHGYTMERKFGETRKDLRGETDMSNV